MASLSLAMIVKNEAKFLDTCLRSIKDHVDEIIIVDTGSTDKTITIAKQYGAQVFSMEWVDDFAKARNYSLEKATCDWIIRLDADEEFLQGHASKIKSVIETSTTDIVSIDIFDEMGAESFSQPRIFKNHVGLGYEGAIHEQLVYEDRTKLQEVTYSDLKVVHHGYRPELVDMTKKEARNREILEASLAEDPENEGLRYHYASHLEQQGLIDQAIENYKMIKGDDGKLIGPLTQRRIVNCFIKTKSYQNAADQALHALKKYPNYTDLWFLAGICELSLSNVLNAKRNFEECLRLGASPKGLPGTPGSDGPLASLFLGFCLFQEGNASKAEQYFAGSLPVIRKDPEIMAFLAKLFLIQNDRSIAEKKFKDLADLSEPRILHIYGIYFPSPATHS